MHYTGQVRMDDPIFGILTRGNQKLLFPVPDQLTEESTMSPSTPSKKSNPKTSQPSDWLRRWITPQQAFAISKIGVRLAIAVLFFTGVIGAKVMAQDAKPKNHDHEKKESPHEQETKQDSDKSSNKDDDKEEDKEKKLTPKLAPITWDGKAKNLIPKKDLGDWEAISFGGEGDCEVKDGVLKIQSGDPMTGVNLPVKDLPKTNYEINLEARRTEGIDFFCGLIFPVNDDHCCLIVGGWSGAVVGLSNIDDEDASSNASRRLMTFKDEQWYKIRIRVLKEQIVVWIDDECVIDQNIKGRKISLRGDTLSCMPLGMCTFQTSSETRKLSLRSFKLKSDK